MRQGSVKLELAENMQKDVLILLLKMQLLQIGREDTQIAIIKHCAANDAGIQGYYQQKVLLRRHLLRRRHHLS